MGGNPDQHGFAFDQFGPRVPSIVISPRIPKNRIDHRVYDHSTIPATLEVLFGLRPLTVRDAAANDLTTLLTLASPRDDAPRTLPNPAASGITHEMSVAMAARSIHASKPTDSIDRGNIPGFLHSAVQLDLDASPAADRSAILARVQTLRTNADAQAYLDEVRVKIRKVKP
jgi:phospholipase C